LTVDDVDNDSRAEIISLSNNGVLSVYETSYPDNSLSLNLNSSGFFVNVENIGLEDSQGANLTLYTLNESFSQLINVPAGSIRTYFFDFNPSYEGEFDINIVVSDELDYNAENNEESISVEVINVTSDEDYEFFTSSYYFDLSNEFSSELEFSDANNDGVNEFIIDSLGNGYDLIRDGNNFISLGDLSLNVNHFYDEIYEDEFLEVFGTVINEADYPVYNVSAFLLMDDEIIDFVYFNMSSDSNNTFSFNITQLNPGTSMVKVLVDYEQQVFENDESNNIQGKNVLIAELLVHNLTTVIDLTSTSVENNYLKLRIFNYGGYDEELTISSDNDIIETQTIIVNNSSVDLFLIPLNIDYEDYFFNLTINNSFYHFDEFISLSFQQEEVLEQDEDFFFQEENDSSQELNEEENIENNYSLISGAFTVDGGEFNPIIYWGGIVILLIIASVLIYFVSFKFFSEQAQFIAITNFILFAGLAYVFHPSNMHIILLEQIIISLAVFSIVRRL
jgi:hypothetical protein